MTEILDELFSLRDEGYAQFSSGLLPNIPRDCFIGVRTPALRNVAKRLYKNGEYNDFLDSIPHRYFDENQLHGFIISLIKDEAECQKRLSEFLPCIDNWATCDQCSPVIFKKNPKLVLTHIDEWLKSGHTYTIRFGIGMLMQHFLDELFEERFLLMVLGVQSEEYYVNMEIAWYMATALAKQWDSAIRYLENGCMESFIHNKTIQKARESYRISSERKEYLKTLRK